MNGREKICTQTQISSFSKFSSFVVKMDTVPNTRTLQGELVAPGYPSSVLIQISTL